MIKKKRVSLLIMIILLLNSVILPRDMKAATSSEKKYLVLVENAENEWIAYDNIVRISNGQPMVSAEIMARALGYLYDENTGSDNVFKVTNTNNVSNKYTIGKKYYNTISGKTTKKVEAKNKAAVTINNLNYCEPESIGKLCNYTYFKGSSIKEYKKYSNIEGIYCFSTVKKTKTLPKYNKVYTPYSNLWYKTFVDLNVEEVDSTTIYGVTFPRREYFLKNYEIMKDVNGKDFPVFAAIKEKCDEYTKAYREANKIDFTGNGRHQLDADRWYRFAYLKDTYNHILHCFSVNDTIINGEAYWKLSMTNHFQPIEKDLNSLKAMCYLLSSTPETLYNVITYDMFEYPVVPGVPGLMSGRIGEEWIGELAKDYGDFSIYVNQDMDVDSLKSSKGDLYAGIPFMPGLVYYIKKGN